MLEDSKDRYMKGCVVCSLHIADSSAPVIWLHYIVVAPTWWKVPYRIDFLGLWVKGPMVNTKFYIANNSAYYSRMAPSSDHFIILPWTPAISLRQDSIIS